MSIEDGEHPEVMEISDQEEEAKYRDTNSDFDYPEDANMEEFSGGSQEDTQYEGGDGPQKPNEKAKGD